MGVDQGEPGGPRRIEAVLTPYPKRVGCPPHGALPPHHHPATARRLPIMTMPATIRCHRSLMNTILGRTSHKHTCGCSVPGLQTHLPAPHSRSARRGWWRSVKATTLPGCCTEVASPDSREVPSCMTVESSNLFCFWPYRGYGRTCLIMSTAVPGDATKTRAYDPSHPEFTDGLRVPAWYTDLYSLRANLSRICGRNVWIIVGGRATQP